VDRQALMNRAWLICRRLSNPERNTGMVGRAIWEAEGVHAPESL